MKTSIRILKNKYLASLLFFFVWMLFLDRNDLVSQWEYRQRLDQIKKDQVYYREQVVEVKKDFKELSSDPAHLEKFAREKYFMKKDNEDVYVIIHQ